VVERQPAFGSSAATRVPYSRSFTLTADARIEMAIKTDEIGTGRRVRRGRVSADVASACGDD
jgi:hypothetical protein